MAATSLYSARPVGKSSLVLTLKALEGGLVTDPQARQTSGSLNRAPALPGA